MIKRKSKDKVYYYCSNYYINKTCENDANQAKAHVEDWFKDHDGKCMKEEK